MRTALRGTALEVAAMQLDVEGAQKALVSKPKKAAAKMAGLAGLVSQMSICATRNATLAQVTAVTQSAATTAAAVVLINAMDTTCTALVLDGTEIIVKPNARPTVYILVAIARVIVCIMDMNTEAHAKLASIRMIAQKVALWSASLAVMQMVNVVILCLQLVHQVYHWAVMALVPTPTQNSSLSALLVDSSQKEF
jgi:hypothetical protein